MIKTLQLVLDKRWAHNETIYEFEKVIEESGDKLFRTPNYNRNKYLIKVLYNLDKKKLLRSLDLYKKDHIFTILMGTDIFQHYYLPFMYHKNKSFYLFDAWYNSHPYIESLSKNFKINNIFFSSKIVAEIFAQKKLSTNFHWVPEAVEVDSYSFVDYDMKNIDVVSFGRRWEKVHKDIVDKLKDNNYNYLYKQESHLFKTWPDFINGIARCKISICFPHSLTSKDINYSIETMTVRYLQSMAAKCLVVGKLPAEMKELFNYVPMIDLDLNDPYGHLDSILCNYKDYIPLIEKNYKYVKDNHRWKHRWHKIREIILENV